MDILTENEIIQILKKNNYKVTPQRLEICKIVLSSKNHPSVEEIYEKVKRKHPMISLATIYKTLILLEEIGLVNELHFNDNQTRYDPKTSLHINVVCPECMSIYDIESEVLSKNWKSIISEIKGEISGQRIDVYKICEKCSKRD